MNGIQKAIKYAAIGFAVFLTVSIIGGILSVCSVFLGSSAVGDMKTYTLTRPPLDVVYRYPYDYAIDIDIGAAELVIKNSDSFCVKSNIKDLSVKESNDGIVIKTDKKLLGSYNGSVVELYIPGNGTLPDTVPISKMNISVGAGKITLDGENISLSSLKLELGAGEVDIKNISLRSGDIDCGLGEITVDNCECSDELKLNSGVGETNLKLSGSKDDYVIDIDKGLGETKIGGKSVKDGYTYDEGGECELSIDCGVGSVEVSFANQN